MGDLSIATKKACAPQRCFELIKELSERKTCTEAEIDVIALGLLLSEGRDRVAEYERGRQEAGRALFRVWSKIRENARSHCGKDAEGDMAVTSSTFFLIAWGGLCASVQEYEEIPLLTGEEAWNTVMKHFYREGVRWRHEMRETSGSVVATAFFRWAAVMVRLDQENRDWDEFIEQMWTEEEPQLSYPIQRPQWKDEEEEEEEKTKPPTMGELCYILEGLVFAMEMRKLAIQRHAYLNPLTPDVVETTRMVDRRLHHELEHGHIEVSDMNTAIYEFLVKVVLFPFMDQSLEHIRDTTRRLAQLAIEDRYVMGSWLRKRGAWVALMAHHVAMWCFQHPIDSLNDRSIVTILKKRIPPLIDEYGIQYKKDKSFWEGLITYVVDAFWFGVYKSTTTVVTPIFAVEKETKNTELPFIVLVGTKYFLHDNDNQVHPCASFKHGLGMIHEILFSHS